MAQESPQKPADVKPVPDSKAAPKATSKADAYFDGAVKDWPLRVRILTWICYRAVLAFGKLYWRWSVRGADPFKSGGHGRQADAPRVGRVFVSNHASMFDPAFLVAYAGYHGQSLRPMYKSELGESKFVTWFFSRVGGLPIKRGTADTKAIKRAVAALKRGENILIFPEGTRVWDPQARPEVHGGFSLIAIMAGADVVPLAIDGTERINPNKAHKFPRPSRVLVEFGEPIALDAIVGSSRKEKAAELEDKAMKSVYAMRDALHGQQLARR